MGIKDNPKMAEKMFKPGFNAHANPGGRPVTQRNRLQGAFLRTLADDFDKYGRAAIEYMRRNDPSAYVKVCASLMPKEFKQVSPLEEMTEAELVAAVEHIRSKIVGIIEPRVIAPPGTESVN